MEVEEGLQVESVEGITVYFPFHVLHYSELLTAFGANADKDQIFLNVEITILLLIRSICCSGVLPPCDCVTLIKLTKAAAYLIMPGLVDRCTTALANIILGMTSYELRAFCGIESDFCDSDMQLLLDENENVTYLQQT